MTWTRMVPGALLMSAALASSAVCLAGSTCMNGSSATPADPLYAKQWPHINAGGSAQKTVDADIDTPRAWECTLGNPSVVIAIIDVDGIFPTHPDLIDNLSPGGWDFVLGSAQINPLFHGTGVTGIAVASANDIGLRGSCPKCHFIPIRADGSKLVAAIQHARDKGARIVAIPPFTEASLPQTALDAIAAADPSLILITGAGNDSKDVCGGSYFQKLGNVMTVGSSTSRDTRALGDPGKCLSGGTKCNGNGIGDCLDLLAPSWHEDGCGDSAQNPPPTCTSPVPTTSWSQGQGPIYTEVFGGTSASRPLVAGVVGLLLSVRPDLTRDQVRRLLQDTADKIEPSKAQYDPTTGFSSPSKIESGGGKVDTPSTHAWGRINAFEAVRIVAPSDKEWTSAVPPWKWKGGGGVDVFMRDNQLDWGNTEQPSSTEFEPTSSSTRPSIPYWGSPDIKIDTPPVQSDPPAGSKAFDTLSDESATSVPGGKANRVYVRIRNRGPDPAPDVAVRVYWAWATDPSPGGGSESGAPPPVPADFWSTWTAPGGDHGEWHRLPCPGKKMPSPGGQAEDAQEQPACIISVLPYSGASAASCPRSRPACGSPALNDEGKVVAFTLTAHGLGAGQSRDLYLLTIVDSTKDPVGESTKGSLNPTFFTPRDNNVALKRITIKGAS